MHIRRHYYNITYVKVGFSGSSIFPEAITEIRYHVLVDYIYIYIYIHTLVLYACCVR